MNDPQPVPELIPPSLLQQRVIMELTDAINEILAGQDAHIVMSIITSVVLGGYAGASADLRAVILADVEKLAELLKAIGDATEPAEIARRVATVVPNNVFTKGRPAGGHLQ